MIYRYFLAVSWKCCCFLVLLWHLEISYFAEYGLKLCQEVQPVSFLEHAHLTQLGEPYWLSAVSQGCILDHRSQNPKQGTSHVVNHSLDPFIFFSGPQSPARRTQAMVLIPSTSFWRMWSPFSYFANSLLQPNLDLCGKVGVHGSPLVLPGVAASLWPWEC